MDPDLFRGVEVDQVSVWKDPEDGTVIFQVLTIPGSPQIRIAKAKWLQIIEFLSDPVDE